MKIKQSDLPKIRIPLAKQRNQVFKDKTKYDRKKTLKRVFFVNN